MDIVEQTKDLLSEDRHRIKLHDLVAARVKEVLPLIADDQFPTEGNWSDVEFIDRLKKYEEITSDLRGIQMLLAYWGTNANRETLVLALKQICGRLKPASGVTAWINLRFYPAHLLLYVGGIAAVAAGKYDNLRVLLQANIEDPEQSHEGATLIRRISNAIQDIGDAFKRIPGRERNYTARSEYLFELLRPTMNALLFLGAEFESYFDQFEVLLALEHAYQYASEQSGRLWGPIGRFGWKFKRGDHSSPLHRVFAEAEGKGNSWPPIVAGLFGGSIEQFKKIAKEYGQLISQLGWI